MGRQVLAAYTARESAGFDATARAMSVPAWLSVAGLVVTLAGAGFGSYGTWVSPHQAFEIGVTRWAGDTEQENSNLPAVRNLRHQAQFAMWGFVLIAFGTVIQIVGAFSSVYSRVAGQSPTKQPHDPCRRRPSQ
jgi:hypothetical protein